MMPLRVGHRQTITISQASALVGQEAARRLTLWALRRYLERNGFDRPTAQRLIFMRWVAVTRRLIGT
jgi:hypothetical protein